MIPPELRKYDYRSNLIVDKNNPALIQKASRDRFSALSHWREGYGGIAYLGRNNSEDALTWNVFRFLQQSKIGLRFISEVFEVSEIQNVLFWGMDAEASGEEQQLVNILIRTIDGKHRGTVTEPDLIFISEKEVCFVECKLNQNGNTSPWRTTNAQSSEKRMNVYREVLPELIHLDDWINVYQMIRQYIYAKVLGKILGKQPRVYPLINERHQEILQPYYSSLLNWDKDNIFHDFLTWQTILKRIRSSSIDDKEILLQKMNDSLHAVR